MRNRKNRKSLFIGLTVFSSVVSASLVSALVFNACSNRGDKNNNFNNENDLKISKEYKDKLIEIAKNIDYPEKPNTKAIELIINDINLKYSELKIRNEKDFNNYKKRLSEISNFVLEINNELNRNNNKNIYLEEFKSSETIYKLENLLNKIKRDNLNSSIINAKKQINKLVESEKKKHLLDVVNNSSSINEIENAENEANNIIEKAKNKLSISNERLLGSTLYAINKKFINDELTSEEDLTNLLKGIEPNIEHIKNLSLNNANKEFILNNFGEEFKNSLINEINNAKFYYNYDLIIKKISTMEKLIEIINDPNFYYEIPGIINNISSEIPKEFNYIEVPGDTLNFVLLNSDNSFLKLDRLILVSLLSKKYKNDSEAVPAFKEILNKFDELNANISNKEVVTYEDYLKYKNKYDAIFSFANSDFEKYLTEINSLPNEKQNRLLELYKNTNKIVQDNFNSNEEIEELENQINLAKSSI
ncbi:Uncharacterised protein [Mycoplasmopsis maculosa]|uniref:Lipoprotein n=1 Tax=Mycoplasmopsis maculosa TaxID=114885 RepID=A0A449B3R5_9BACT|nr:hypothetical protein [Mycoplasmopsis maculosa]VEU75209.1 Uncharacterised protein [Mycoplasmopsis maculosa]